MSIAILLAALPVMTLLLLGVTRLEGSLERPTETSAAHDR